MAVGNEIKSVKSSWLHTLNPISFREKRLRWKSYYPDMSAWPVPRLQY